MNEAWTALPSNPPDPNGLYFVITSNFPKGGDYCAWHSYGPCNGGRIAVVPNATGVSGCDMSGTTHISYGSAGQSMANIAAHELSDAITGPFLNASYDSSGQEVGDHCAWPIAGTLTRNSGSTWQLQQAWSKRTDGRMQPIFP